MDRVTRKSKVEKKKKKREGKERKGKTRKRKERKEKRRKGKERERPGRGCRGGQRGERGIAEMCGIMVSNGKEGGGKGFEISCLVRV